jgi:hypothetical protein
MIPKNFQHASSPERTLLPTNPRVPRFDLLLREARVRSQQLRTRAAEGIDTARRLVLDSASVKTESKAEISRSRELIHHHQQARPAGSSAAGGGPFKSTSQAA